MPSGESAPADTSSWAKKCYRRSSIRSQAMLVQQLPLQLNCLTDGDFQRVKQGPFWESSAHHALDEGNTGEVSSIFFEGSQ